MLRSLAILVPLSLGSIQAQIPTVTSSTPAANALDVAHNASVAVSFSEPMSLVDVNSDSFRVAGRWSGPAVGNYSLANGGTTIVFDPLGLWSPGEEILVYVDSSVTAQNGNALAASWTAKFWAESMSASMDFGTPSMFTTQFPTPASTRPYGGHAGDFNGDGFPDLAVVCEDTDDVRIYVNDGAGGFPNPPAMHFIGGTPSPSEGGDFNGDGWLDLTVTGGSGVSVFLNDGAGTLLPPVTYSGPSNAHGTAVCDYDGDGDEDIMVTSTAGQVVFAQNDGNGVLSFGGATAAPGGAWGIDSGDMNGDGIEDLIVGGNGQTAVLLGDGAGGFTQAGSISSAHVWQVQVGDLDGDGDLDAIGAATSGELYFVVGDGSGGITTSFTRNAGSFSVASDLGDIDGDGDLDAIASDFGSGQWGVYENLGGGAFSAGFTLSAPNNAACAIIADIDGDGRMEVIGFDEISDDILIWDIGHSSVQKPRPTARLSINGQTSSGLGGSPAVPVPTGSTITLELQGPNSAVYFVYYSSTGVPLGFPLNWGALNLGPLSPTPLAVGFTSAGAAIQDGVGTATTYVAANLPIGFTAWAQGFVAHPASIVTGAQLTNPVGILVTP